MVVTVGKEMKMTSLGVPVMVVVKVVVRVAPQIVGFRDRAAIMRELDC